VKDKICCTRRKGVVKGEHEQERRGMAASPEFIGNNEAAPKRQEKKGELPRLKIPSVGEQQITNSTGFWIEKEPQ